MTANRSPLDVAVAFIEAWARHDMATVAGYAADDISDEGPLAQVSGITAYLDAVGGFAELVTGMTLIAAFGDDRQAVIMYDMTTGPFGTLRAAEQLVISDGKIKTSKLVFDTHEVRKAQAG